MNRWRKDRTSDISGDAMKISYCPEDIKCGKCGKTYIWNSGNAKQSQCPRCSKVYYKIFLFLKKLLLAPIKFLKRERKATLDQTNCVGKFEPEDNDIEKFKLEDNDLNDFL